MGHKAEFNIVKELVGKLRQTLKEARKNGCRMSGAELDSALLSLISLISLAARGLCPAALENSFRQALIRHLSKSVFRLESDLIDRTDFAAHLAKVCRSDHIETLCRQSQFLDEVTRLIKSVELKPDESAVFKDPLLLGWAHQVLLAQRTGYTDLRNSKHVDNLAGLTQWFTPSWIADFLIQESLGSETGSRKKTILDPACGAGHLLVPALRVLAGEKEHSNGKRLNVLSEILEHRLFGLDIDQTVLSQAAFSLYLACREWQPVAPLPIPHLYTFEADVPHLKEEENFGSLLLGLEELPKNIHLKRVDGTTVELNALPRQFSQIATNPPYLSHRSMPQPLARFLRNHYSGRHYDLYAAFLELTIRLMEPGARTAILCQQSFLTIQRYEQLRRELLERSGILTVAHLGPGAFASRGGEKVSNAIITLERQKTSERNDKPLAHSAPIKIFKAASLKEAEELGIDNLPQQSLSQQSMRTLAALIPSSPLALWCPEEIAMLFKKHAPISHAETGISITNGLFTCNNRKFLKHFKDLDQSEVDQFVPYDKGGGKKWYSLTPYYIRWEDGGDSIREYRKKRGQSASLPGEEFYFKEGVTYSYIGTKGFKARLLSPRSVFDIASSALFSSSIDLDYLLGFLNSALVRYILGVLNPTVNFQIGDLRRLPFRVPSKTQEKKIAQLARAAVDIASQLEESDPQSPAYKHSRLQYFAGADYAQPKEAYERMKDRLHDLNAKERAIQRSIDDEIFESYKISKSIREQIVADPWVDSGNKHLVEIPTFAQAMRG